MRIPPQNLDSEKAFLGSILLRPDAMNEVLDTISPHSFYAEKHRSIFMTMQELFNKGEPIDLVSLSTKLKEKSLIDRVGGPTYLAELVNFVPSAANLEHYGSIIQKKHKMRSLIEAAEQIVHLGYDESGELEEILQAARFLVNATSSSSN